METHGTRREPGGERGRRHPGCSREDGPWKMMGCSPLGRGSPRRGRPRTRPSRLQTFPPHCASLLEDSGKPQMSKGGTRSKQALATCWGCVPEEGPGLTRRGPGQLALFLALGAGPLGELATCSPHTPLGGSQHGHARWTAKPPDKGAWEGWGLAREVGEGSASRGSGVRGARDRNQAGAGRRGAGGT